MKCTIEENGVTTKIDSTADFIRHQLDFLIAIRDREQSPSQGLLDDIAVYEFMLNDSDPVKRADEYKAERIRQIDAKNWGASKMDCAKALGWAVVAPVAPVPVDGAE